MSKKNIVHVVCAPLSLVAGVAAAQYSDVSMGIIAFLVVVVIWEQGLIRYSK